jgi:hypothetical protein
VRIALGLTTLATLLAAIVAYGTHPAWAQYRYGLGLILLSRQVQWPALFLSLAAVLAVVALVIAGRQRAWWLIGLAPVMTLFAHRFATDPTAGMASVEDPAFVKAGEAAFIHDEDFVVGLTFGDKAYAYPYAALYSTPVVIHAQHDKRILVMWSPTANRAVATTVKRELRARHLDVVSTPANALLVYDTARGQFINGLTGLTPRGGRPAEFATPVPTAKMRWRDWRALHADTVVMVPTGRLAAKAPRQPLLPVHPMPKGVGGEAPQTPVVVVGTTSPAAVASQDLNLAPLNLTADGAPVLAFRDRRHLAARAFARRVDDLSPRFKANRDPARAARGVAFVDTDTDTGWSADGVAVDAKREYRGKRLQPVVVEDGLYWGVMKHWYPDLELAAGEAAPVVAEATPAPVAPTTAPAAKARRGGGRGERVTRAGQQPPARRRAVQQSRAE